MEFRILGPFEVVREDNTAIALDRKKARALLAFFVLHANDPLAADRLIDELWGETPPRTATASLQNYVSRLRKALGPDVLVSHPPGYMLRAEADQIDARRFERLVREARAADPAERAEKLREALALWRGRPLDDLAYEPFAQAEIRRLEELRLTAVEERIDADLAVGGGGDLVGELESLVEEHPLRERFRRQLMLALYRVGRQSEALRAYRETRAVLRAELGIEPSAELQRVERAILVHDPALEPPPAPHVAAPAPSVARKTVTVLFADLVESTALAEMLDPEAYRTVLSGFYAEMGTVIGLHGGTVEKFSGDEVMAVFGVPVTHEDDALRAIRAALEMTTALEELNESLERDLGIQLGLRTGINTGEVAVGPAAAGGSFVTGAPVIVAKRLEQATAPGEVLIGPATLELVREAVETEAFGAVALRGRKEPIDAHRVLGAIEGAPAIARRLTAPMVGRDEELARLHSELEQVRAERACRVVAVLGEAGIGKSRLLAELATSAREDCSVVVGRCVAYGEGATYLPLVDIVRQAGARSQEEFEALLAGEDDAPLVARRIAELVGLAEGAVPPGEAPWAVRRFFEGLARARPLVVVIEDAHWAEASFIDLLEYLDEWIEGAPVLLVCSARPEVLNQRAAWTPPMSIELHPLTDADTTALIESLVGDAELDRAARKRIVAIAEGNPLYAEQLVAFARERGPEVLADVPPSLEALLASRLDLLDREECFVLQRASVVGREFWRQAIVDLSPEAEAPAVGRHLDTLVGKGLVWPAVEEDGFRFHHVLIRDVAYAGIPKHERAELHERHADWLDLQPSPADEVVGYHLEQAYNYRTELGAVDRSARQLAEEAGDRLGRAGLRAWRSADATATSNLLGRAISLLRADSPRRRELLPELAIALRTAGQIDQAETVLTDAITASTAATDRRTELRARMELANVRLFSEPGSRAAQLLEIIERAIPTFEAIRDDRALGRAYLLTGYVRGGHYCQNEAWRDAAEQAIIHYRRAGWPPSTCIGELAAALYNGPTRVDEGIARLEELLAEPRTGRSGRAHALAFLGGLEAQLGRFTRARSLLADAEAVYVELGQAVVAASNCGVVRGAVETLADSPDAAERALAEACNLFANAGERAKLATVAAELADALYVQGRYDDALAQVAIARRHSAADDVTAEFSWRSVHAKLLARDGAFDKALNHATEAVQLAERTDGLNQRAKVLRDHAEVLSMAGRLDEASRAVGEAVDLFTMKGNSVAAGKAMMAKRNLVPA